MLDRVLCGTTLLRKTAVVIASCHRKVQLSSLITTLVAVMMVLLKRSASPFDSWLYGWGAATNNAEFLEVCFKIRRLSFR